MLLNCGVGEDSWESLGLQRDPTDYPKDQSWVFIGRTDAEAEASILWPPDAKSWLIRKEKIFSRKNLSVMSIKIEGRRRRGRQRTRCLHGITDSMNRSLSRLWEMLKDREAWHAAIQGVRGSDMTERPDKKMKKIIFLVTKYPLIWSSLTFVLI